MAEILKKWREQFKIDDNGLSVKVGIDPRTLTNWQRGRTKPNKRVWRRISTLINKARY